jgi:hypothetical protein
MTGAEWIALAGLGITALGGLGWLGTLTWHGGRQAQKLDNIIGKVDRIELTQTEHATAIATWPQVIKLLEEVRKDVKGLLTARVRRTSEAGD